MCHLQSKFKMEKGTFSSEIETKAMNNAVRKAEN